MIKRLTLLISYFLILSAVLFILILYSLYFFYSNNQPLAKKPILPKGYASFKALPDVRPEINSIAVQEDARISVLKDFFKQYRSPLIPFADKIVEAADKYNIDYRLLPAIAMQESNLCRKIPKGSSHNCWGFGIYGKKHISFASFEEAIETISASLAKGYIAKGYQEPYEIMKKYAPSNNGTWAESVTGFMEKISSFL